MRLSSQEIAIIKKILQSYSKEAKIFLHGSRIDDLKKGGDIDLFFVVPDESFKDITNNKIIISAELSLNLNEQKIDLTCLSFSEETTNSFFKNSQKIEL
jgi:predicted nucleotidyltransferase